MYQSDGQVLVCLNPVQHLVMFLHLNQVDALLPADSVIEEPATSDAEPAWWLV